VLANELAALANEKGAPLRKAQGMIHQGCVLAQTGRTAEAVQMITAGVAAWRSTGATLFTPWHMSVLGKVHARLGQFDDAWRCISEAVAASEASKESWYDAEMHRLAAEIVLISDEQDAAKAEAHFKRALAIARQHQAKSFELRAAMSMARLWRDHGRRGEAHDLLAPVYGWFTEGFDTLDLTEAKALLGELHS
jgi:predicted ATPase